MKFNIINSFPNFKKAGFCMETYNRQFIDSNVIIHAKACEVGYPDHWGPLSVKCALNGKEYYRVNNCNLAVDNKRYLILNNGNYYNSYINSDSTVESFTLNFTPELLNDALASFSFSNDFVMENLGYSKTGIEFYEKLYEHDQSVSPLILKLKSLTHSFKNNISHIEEIYFLLIEKLILNQKALRKNIREVPAIKLSTKKELYKRLVRAKDYIDSTYNKDITLAALSNISLLNQTYFLRQFKNYFKITPRQYLIRKRMEVAKELLETQKQLSVTDICLQVGYSDLSSFSKLFKYFYKYSPENYQRLVLNAGNLSTFMN